MIIKKKWSQLSTENSFISILGTDELSALQEIDTLLRTLSSLQFTKLEDVAKMVKQDFLASTGNWKDMPVFLSSYKEYDKRVLTKIQYNLYQYIAFYKKLLTDEGVGRKIVTQHNYQSNRTGKNKNTGLNSQTPQYTGLYNNIEQKLSNTELEKALANYASDISRDESDTQQNDSGASGTTITGSSWKESLDNLKMLYFNELIDYIISIPNMVFNYYALDSYPLPELCKMYFENVKATFSLDNE